MSELIELVRFTAIKGFAVYVNPSAVESLHEDSAGTHIRLRSGAAYIVREGIDECADGLLDPPDEDDALDAGAAYATLMQV